MAAHAQAPEDPLQALNALLQPLGLSHQLDQHVLHPGQRRQQLVRAMLTRLLGGCDVDDIRFGGAEALHELAEDERFAEKCHSVLKLFGITATPQQLRGCSSDQRHDTLPLLHMAQLLQAMEKQRAGSSTLGTRPSDQQQQLHEAAAPPAGSIAQLLCSAAANLSKLTAEAMQLFPSDMSAVLKAYSDQGALGQLPSLSQEATSRAQRLQQQLQQALQSGGSECEGAGSNDWWQAAADTAAALESLLRDTRAFDAMYEQELSVWASSTRAEEQQLLPWPAPQPAHDSAAPLQAAAAAGDPDSHGGAAGSVVMVPAAEATGRIARSLVAGYQELTELMAALDAIRVQHTALKDVPAAMLQEQRARHLNDTNKMRMFAAAVHPCQSGP